MVILADDIIFDICSFIPICDILSFALISENIYIYTEKRYTKLKCITDIKYKILI